MQYSARADEPSVSEGISAEATALRGPLEALVRELGLELIDLGVFRTKGRKGSPPGAQVRAVVYKPGPLGTDDCSRAHRAILPLLEDTFPGNDISVEVSTPGINRLVKDGVELAHYRGRGVRLWRTDVSDWSTGLLEAVDEQGITIKGKEGTIRLEYAIIAKAKLDPSQEE
jgi:ribosome maturation factor RimP